MLEIYCDVGGWEFESSAIGDTLSADGALEFAGIDGDGAEELIVRLVWNVFILGIPKMTPGMNTKNGGKVFILGLY